MLTALSSDHCVSAPSRTSGRGQTRRSLERRYDGVQMKTRAQKLSSVVVSDAVDSCSQDFTHVITSLQNLFQVSTEILAVSFWKPRGDFPHHLRMAEKGLDGSTPYFKRTSISTHLIQQLLKWKFLHYINIHLTKKCDLIPSWHWALTRRRVMKPSSSSE